MTESAPPPAVSTTPRAGEAPGGSRTALICVDVQNDFCEGGSLAVTGGAAVAAALAAHVRAHRGDYALVVASRDWHIDPGAHWSPEPDFVRSWPVHCRAGSSGAALHPAFATVADELDVVVDKGQYGDGYSAFLGADAAGRDLAGLLREAGIEQVVVAGLATDHCVRATALDARREGFAVRLAADLAAGVDADASRAAVAEMRAAGVTV